MALIRPAEPNCRSQGWPGAWPSRPGPIRMPCRAPR